MIPQFHLYLRAGYLHPVAGALGAFALGAPVWAACMALVLGEGTRRGMLADGLGAGHGR